MESVEVRRQVSAAWCPLRGLVPRCDWAVVVDGRTVHRGTRASSSRVAAELALAQRVASALSDGAAVAIR